MQKLANANDHESGRAELMEHDDSTGGCGLRDNVPVCCARGGGRAEVKGVHNGISELKMLRVQVMHPHVELRYSWHVQQSTVSIDSGKAEPQSRDEIASLRWRSTQQGSACETQGPNLDSRVVATGWDRRQPTLNAVAHTATGSQTLCAYFAFIRA